MRSREIPKDHQPEEFYPKFANIKIRVANVTAKDIANVIAKDIANVNANVILLELLVLMTAKWCANSAECDKN